MKELFDKYMNIIPNLLKNLRTNMKNMNNNGGIDLYINLVKISLLINKIEKENKTDTKKNHYQPLLFLKNLIVIQISNHQKRASQSSKQNFLYKTPSENK